MPWEELWGEDGPDYRWNPAPGEPGNPPYPPEVEPEMARRGGFLIDEGPGDSVPNNQRMAPRPPRAIRSRMYQPGATDLQPASVPNQRNLFERMSRMSPSEQDNLFESLSPSEQEDYLMAVDAEMARRNYVHAPGDPWPWPEDFNYMDDEGRMPIYDYENLYGRPEPTDLQGIDDTLSDFSAQVRDDIRPFEGDYEDQIPDASAADTFRNPYDLDVDVDYPNASELDEYRSRLDNRFFDPAVGRLPRKPTYNRVSDDLRQLYIPQFDKSINLDLAPVNAAKRNIKESANAAKRNIKESANAAKRKLNDSTQGIRKAASRLSQLPSTIRNSLNKQYYFDRQVIDPKVNWEGKEVIADLDRFNMLVGGGKRPFGIGVQNFGDEVNLEFSGPGGYASVNELKSMRDYYKSQGDIIRADKLDDQISAMQDPFYRPALKFHLGQVLDEQPAGSRITYSPIGGTGGQRDKAYTRATKGALTSDPRYGGKSEKMGPTTWKNAQGKIVEFNPKDLMRRGVEMTFTTPDMDTQAKQKLVDNILKNTDDFKPHVIIPGNPNRPPISINSPEMAIRRGVVNHMSSAAAEMIPSRDVVKTLYETGPRQAAIKMAGELFHGHLTGTAVGAGSMLLPKVPVIGAPLAATALPLVPGIAGGAGIVAGAEALDELSKQQTGEGLLPKFRQTIGTKPRSGIASKGAPKTPIEQFKRDMELINNPPTVKPYQKNPLYNDVTNELQRRARMAIGRFNPGRGEFGITEMLFGR